jgi:predicted enzyme related to lactoylglutathione lyase
MNGKFVWFDLSTTDLAAAQAFYTELLGWQVETLDMDGQPYPMWKAGGHTFGGMMPLRDDARAMGVPPSWLGYVGVENVDAAVERCRSLGGQVHVPGTDIPNIGRFAILADPQGATFAVYGESKGQMAEGFESPADWHELNSQDPDAGWSFYEAMFGWKKMDTMDMGPEHGTYLLFGQGDEMLGGIMRSPKEMPVSAWTYYFKVPDAHAATERAKALGARVLHGPMQVPGGGWVTMMTDPQGAMFAVSGPGKA